MASLPLTLGSIGFGAAALIYFAVAALTISVNPRTASASWLVGALLVSGLWAAVLCAAVWLDSVLLSWSPTLDALHTLVWVLFLAASFTGADRPRSWTFLRNVLVVAALLLTAVVVVWGKLVLGRSGGSATDESVLIALLGLPLLGLLTLEQLFRNSHLQQRRVLQPLSIGVGLIFAIDLFVYSQAVLFQGIDWRLWLLRGVVNAAAAPAIILAVKRQPDWERELFVSRHIVFYTTTLLAAGLYLLALGVGGYLLGTQSMAWAPWLQLVFFVVAGGLFLYTFFSTTVRSHLKASIAKHFYRNRYDYREKWLQLIETLAGPAQQRTLSDRGVKALADIIGSSRGELWLRSREGAVYEDFGSWGGGRPAHAITEQDALVQFLNHLRWVIDTDEYLEDPGKYANAFAADGKWIATPSIIVPLVRDNDLVGVVRLDRPPGLGRLKFEDHDLLKTAGKQVAIFLVQERSQEELAETRQFEAFSKLTTFLMHDLKNVIAQQELVVGNAKRFKNRPEFVDDAFRTIESSVERMKSILSRLQGAVSDQEPLRVDLVRLIQDVCAACSDRQPTPSIATGASPVWVVTHRDRLSMAVTHAVRNAQDATAADGRVELRLLTRDGMVVIEVEDTGIGMDAAFIRDRLFKPFDSTKGAQGMGIGAYQIRETLRLIGGDVEVTSELDRGTLVRLKVPLHADAAALNSESAA